MKNLTKSEYELRLSQSPDHSTPEFIDFLREHNNVIWENQHWIIIENCKYENWRTAFWKHTDFKSGFYKSLGQVLDQYPECEWRKKHGKKQSIKRFHIHIISM